MRGLARTRRRTEARTEAAAALAALALGHLKLGPREVVAGYVAMKDELDPGPLMAALGARGHGLGLPCIGGRGLALTFRRYRPGDLLQDGPFGTREPRSTAEPVHPTVLLVPLLAFDRKGFRLGYGGGYYDRTLRLLRARGPLTALGLAYSFQEIDTLPHEDHDERLDMIATERELIIPAPAAL